MALEAMRAEPVALPPKDLYVECLSKEKKLKGLNLKKAVRESLKFYLFEGHPLFPQLGSLLNWSIELTRQLEPIFEKRRPFDFSIVNPGDSAACDEAWRYQQLLGHLKETKTIELRLLLIARWLKQEGVCEPEEIMPRIALDRVLKSFGRKEKISNKDTYNWYSVRIWIPYFERLLNDMHSTPKNNQGLIESLRNQGYEQGAIESSTGKRSAIPAVASWLEHRNGRPDAHTLENAYSRMEAKRRRSFLENK